MIRNVVQTDDGLNQMLTALEKHERSSTDAEFVPQPRHSGKPDLVGWSHAVRLNNQYVSWYIPLGHTVEALACSDRSVFPKGARNFSVDAYLKKTKKFFESLKHVHVCHSSETESEALKFHGTELGTIRDTMIEAWLYDEEGLYPYRLKECTMRVLGRKAKTIQEVVTAGRTKVAKMSGAEKADLSKVPVEQAALYATDDSINTLQLNEWFEPELQSEGLMTAYTKIELPMVKIFRDMAMRGIPINIKECHKQLKIVSERLDQIETDVYKVAGRPFNIRSRQQLGKILFEELKYPEMQVLDPEDKTGERMIPFRTPTGQYKTSDPVMQWLAEKGYPLGTLIASHGDLEKIKGTYLQAWIDAVDNTSDTFPKYHPSLWQVGTLIGRSSGDLQQVPRPDKDFDAKWERAGARKLSTAERVICLRKIIGVDENDPKEWLLCCDYNQVELRMFAHFSLDPNLVGAYCHGMDFHQATADSIIAAGVKAFSRQDAKPINFGLIYGLVLATFIQMFGDVIGRKVFNALMERYKAAMQYKDAVIHQAHLDEFVRSIAWRKRRLPEINSDHFPTRSFAEREAFHMLISGSSADVMKMAQIEMARKLPDIPQNLQVHDEVISHLSGWTKKQSLEIAHEVKGVFESVGKTLDLNVPLVAEPKIAKNWLEAK